MLTVILELQLTGGGTAGAAARTAGLASAFSHTFWWAVGFTVIGALPALLLRGPARSER
ncbi:MAG TPA: hypothetical protein VGJ19_22395 [Streptosporangiaceae bacterium]